MPRSASEIQADLDRLNAELAEAGEEHTEVVEEALDATEDAIEDAAEDATEEVTEAIEDAAEDAVEDAPLIDAPGDAEAAIAARVVETLTERYDLIPRATEPVIVEEHHETIVHASEDEAPVETAPHSVHWSRRPLFRRN